ncbi:murein biosynthesis integral membrane protein MurJ [Bermanella marisrubri]|uniref:Probable lipid II flippase MurJ n=1 Tax=Bermanella marisrubri TaxID=207949 RepID=Q1N0A7_9GAMM|nr:murein biosynthesis integral membrane protein MurJ [Bermanella marisrubri]EAT11610.1 integral membrane protein MviN [Oceanobacter sp. RED65] [Bermanella marisrubri]QIZ83346.1 murein biosynthesis integral membrane protein MurJ [Bermanella marisrubri]
MSDPASPEKSENQPSSPKKASGLLRSSSIVSVMTLLSRILGLVRDVFIATYFGARADAFLVAFKIPNFFRRLFAEGAFSVAFVPVLSEYKVKDQDVKSLVSAVSGTLLAILGPLTVVAVAGAPLLTWIFAPGFANDAEKFALTSDLLRITFPYLLLISLTAFYGSVLNTYGQFAIPAVTPVLLNICLILATYYFTPWFDEPLMALAWGVLLAGVTQLAFQLPFVMKLGLLALPKPGFADSGVKRIMKLMIPALFGVSVSQINLLLDVLLASFLQPGSVSWLYYSDRLSQLPLGVFAIAIGVVILPNLSQRHASEDKQHFVATLDWAVRMVLLIGVPAALALMVLSVPLMATIFYRGEITAFDVEKMALSLQAYGAGLLAFMLIKVLAPGFYARQNTKTPVKIAMAAMIVNMVLNLILIFPFAHVGLAMATTLSAYLNAGLLFWFLRKDGHYVVQPGWWLWIARLILGNALMLVVLLMINPDTAQWLEFTEWQRIAWTGLLVGAGIAVYGGSLLISGVRLRHLRMS